MLLSLVTETMLLSLAGGGFGLFVAYVSVRALVAANPGNLPESDEYPRRYRGSTLAISIVTGLLFGVLPALHADKLEDSECAPAGRPISGRRRTAKKALVVTEAALALVLVADAGLMLRSLSRLTAVNPGFDASQLLPWMSH
jgi:putative ABC transport system permease protein